MSNDGVMTKVNDRGVVELLEVNGQVLTLDTARIAGLSMPCDYTTRTGAEGWAHHELTGGGELRLRFDDYVAALQWRPRV